MSPEQIGRYIILRTLGRGAMGVVYLARDPQIERELALKTIRFDTGEKSFGVDEAKARFLKEARISGRLQHPHIVTVFDVGEDQGTLFLAMELVQGGSFSQRLSDPAGFPLRDRIRVVAEVAEALAHAHERGVLHRDVKPANILLSPTLSAKVTDFGIGKLLTGDTDLTSTGQMVGSPAYMSPEQIKGEKLDARTDIFSLGIVLYQALTLRKPFPADTLTTLVYQILHEEPMDPGLVTNEVPEGMKDIIKKCLAKDRANRYSDAGELAGDLREILGFSPVGSTAGLSESKVKRVRPPPGAPPPVAPLAGPAIPASMARDGRFSRADTSAMKISPPVGTSPEVAASYSAPPEPPMPAAATPVADSESPTITTGRRMGEVMAKGAGAAAPPPTLTKKRISPFVLGGGLLAVAAVVLGVLALSKKSEKEVGELPPVPTSAPAASVPAPVPTQPPPAAKVPEPTGASTAGPAVAVVETPVPDASPTVAPTKKARVKPAAAPEAATAAAAAVPTAPKAPAQKPADLTVTVRRFLKLDVSPNQARVYLDGRYIGISDDWDDGGGGSLLAFNLEGTHRLRICAPGYHDLLVDLIVRSTATDDKVAIDRSLEKGSPDGSTGPAWLPEAKLKRPSYRTVRDAVFNVEPPEALVSVNGRVLGPASNKDFQFAEMAVYEVLLTAPGYESKSLRILAGPAAGEVRANIKEKLKKM
ncbi:MAG: serine/threonine-protein kinase [Thermoanaerobaculia bacterium]